MNRTDIPRPFYAAAGAGELAYQRLRRLPEAATRTADELRARLAVPERDLAVELARLRESAQRGTATFMARAVGFQDRATASYQRLVARGERLVADRVGMTGGPAGPAEIEVEVGPVQPAERRSAKPAAAGAGKPANGKPSSGTSTDGKSSSGRSASGRPAGRTPSASGTSAGSTSTDGGSASGRSADSA